MQPAASQNSLLSNQNLIPQAQEWAENLSFSLIWAAFYLHLNYTSLLWFCLRKQKWMQSQHVGNLRNESLNKTPILETELVRETQPPAGSCPSTVCDLLTVRDVRVLWTSLRAPLLQQPVTGDYLSPVRLHRQNWKCHMCSDSTSPSMLRQQGARSSRPSEKANCWHSQFPTPLSKEQALFSPSCLQKISFIIFHFLHFAGY